jgi:hypothetical protein
MGIWGDFGDVLKGNIIRQALIATNKNPVSPISPVIPLIPPSYTAAG